MRNLLIKLSPAIFFIVLNMVIIVVISMAAAFIIRGEIDQSERAGMVLLWGLSLSITAPLSFIEPTMPRELMRDILDLMGIK